MQMANNLDLTLLNGCIEEDRTGASAIDYIMISKVLAARVFVDCELALLCTAEIRAAQVK